MEPVEPTRQEVKALIRKARAEDMADIYDILKEEGEPDNEFPPLSHLLRDGFDTSLPWFTVLLAESGGSVVGAAVYCRAYWPRPAPPGRVVFVCALRVRRSARRRGVATGLFRELLRVAQEENAQLNWSHLPSNTEASAFFARYKPDVSDDLTGTYFMRIIPRTVRELAPTLLKSNSTSDVSIKPARPEDMMELMLMLREISETRGTSDDHHLDEKDLLEDGFTSSPPWFFALMAWRSGTIVGTIIGHRAYKWSRSMHMLSLYVRPSARRCGVADRLVVEFCRVAETEGVGHVKFNVHPTNKESLAVFRRFGAERLTMFDRHVAFRLTSHKIKKSAWCCKTCRYATQSICLPRQLSLRHKMLERLPSANSKL